MAIRAGYNKNNIERVLENKEPSYIELEVENDYTEKLLEGQENLPKGLEFIALETQKFDTWSEYYILYAISKQKLIKFPDLLKIALEKVINIFGADTMIDSIDCSRGDYYYVMIFSRTIKAEN